MKKIINNQKKINEAAGQGMFGSSGAAKQVFTPEDTDEAEEVPVEQPVAKKTGMFGGNQAVKIFEPQDDDETGKAGQFGGGKTEGGVPPGCSPSVRYSKQCQDNNLSKGCGGQNVKDLQQKLKLKDPSSLPKFGVDCKFGNETVRAIKKFQSKNGLPSTGVVDQATHDKLFATNENKILNQFKIVEDRYNNIEKLVFERLVKGCK